MVRWPKILLVDAPDAKRLLHGVQQLAARQNSEGQLVRGAYMLKSRIRGTQDIPTPTDSRPRPKL